MELLWLVIGTISVAFIHTIAGPDHYIPFIVLSKARKWSMSKTMIWTLLCGLGHVLSSIVLAILIAFLGIEIFKLESIESIRGEFATWMLILFGMVYSIYGLLVLLHGHAHHHLNHNIDKKKITLWVLFLIFVFGPCEPLIPLILYPAMGGEWLSLMLVAISFSLVTILTMNLVVFLSCHGIDKIRIIDKYEKYFHLIAGIIILLCGLGIKFLGF